MKVFKKAICGIEKILSCMNNYMLLKNFSKEEIT